MSRRIGAFEGFSGEVGILDDALRGVHVELKVSVMANCPDDYGTILQRKRQRETSERGIDVLNEQNHSSDHRSEESSNERHAPAHPAVEGPKMPERGAVVVDLGKHARDVDIAFVKGADGAYACESGAELLEDGRFGVGLETFDLAGARQVEACDVNAEHEKGDGEDDYVG